MKMISPPGRKPTTPEQHYLYDLSRRIYQMQLINPAYDAIRGRVFNSWYDFQATASGGATPETSSSIVVGNEKYRSIAISITSNAENITIDIIEDASFDGGSTDMPIVNMDRTSNLESETTMFEDVTNVSGGEVIKHITMYGQENVGNRTSVSISEDIFIERTFKPNTTYVVRITNNDTNNDIEGVINFYWRERKE